MTVDRSGDPPAPEPVLRRVKISIGAERRTHRGNLRAGGVPRARKTKTRILERKLQKAGPMVRRRPSLIWQKISLIRRFNSLIRAN